jgi:hypothetical protein
MTPVESMTGVCVPVIGKGHPIAADFEASWHSKEKGPFCAGARQAARRHIPPTHSSSPSSHLARPRVLKALGGCLSRPRLKYMRPLRAAGADVAVAYGLDEALPHWMLGRCCGHAMAERRSSLVRSGCFARY